MAKIVNYFAGSKFRLKILLVIVVLLLVSAPTIYAQFIRQTGDTGWGYGYGYGYGLGYGWDDGNIAGYRISGDNLDTIDYGYGYGYLAENQTYNEETGKYEVTIDDMANLYQTGLISFELDGDDIVSFFFTEAIEITVTTGITINIPEGTTFTKTGGGNMTLAEVLTLTGSIPTVTGLPSGFTSQGAVAFGIPTFGITADQDVTLTITGIASAYNGQSLSIYHQTPGSTTWSELGTCPVSGGTCEFSTTSFSSFAATSYSSGSSGTSGSTGGFIWPSEEPTTETPATETTELYANEIPTKPAVQNYTLEAQALDLYKKLFNTSPTGDEWNMVYFIAYGTPSTYKLGAGERAGVIGSYYSAFERKPITNAQWIDVLKIANGRWPGEISIKALERAKVEFGKIYRRSPNMTHNYDNAAVTVMAYGLRPANRNLNSEKVAIGFFRAIYRKAPVTPVDWDIVRAIAYSGATR